ncbi:TlpA disulfide reductase family protein [Cesiribacter sp. SM1]|uniref:TlpA disulfide reductase family protein n=1 Tax=Cesiribacter sp. SM1 TaxID=2861196 RepID=UPI001CD23410|nr:TlpA disulfide reductase family protein [Cesiribacter sp. SM1]
MKQLLVILSVTLFFGCQSQQKQEGFTLQGNINGLDVPYIYMKYTLNGEEQNDSSAVAEGSFTFKGTVDEPGMVLLYSPEARLQKVFYLDNTSMRLEGSADSLERINISGSAVQDDYEALEAQIMKNREQAISFYEKSVKAGEEGDSAMMKEYEARFEEFYNKEPEIRKQFVLAHPNSIVSINELLNYANPVNYAEAREIFAGLHADLKATTKGKELETYLTNLGLAQPGKPALEFSQQDTAGTAVSLASYKGKYVLLEFWASWCGPCRHENPNLRSEYQKYKDSGFDILGVSLDDNRERWLKAIEKDSLGWMQVSDLKGWNNEVAKQYSIRAIPANFLIDPDGNIVARDLRGEALNEKLATLFE